MVIFSLIQSMLKLLLCFEVNQRMVTWDGGEKFYDYEEWLDFIYNSLLSVGLSFSGKIEYRGEDWDDSGVISY